MTIILNSIGKEGEFSESWSFPWFNFS